MTTGSFIHKKQVAGKPIAQVRKMVNSATVTNHSVGWATEAKRMLLQYFEAYGLELFWRSRHNINILKVYVNVHSLVLL